MKNPYKVSTTESVKFHAFIMAHEELTKLRDMLCVAFRHDEANVVEDLIEQIESNAEFFIEEHKQNRA